MQSFVRLWKPFEVGFVTSSDVGINESTIEADNEIVISAVEYDKALGLF